MENILEVIDRDDFIEVESFINERIAIKNAEDAVNVVIQLARASAALLIWGAEEHNAEAGNQFLIAQEDVMLEIATVLENYIQIGGLMPVNDAKCVGCGCEIPKKEGSYCCDTCFLSAGI